MVKGIYTAASGMKATEEWLNTVSNNLANVNTDGYKKETAVLKAFPEMLARRVNDDGQVKFPLGSYDIAPIAGKIGTGVEFNENYIQYEQGNLLETGNTMDFALEGQGFFVLDTPDGERYTRTGNFTINKDNYLVDMKGNYILGENGRIQVGKNNFRIDKDGSVSVNKRYNPQDMVTMSSNDWDQEEVIDKLRVVDFAERRYLERDGGTLYRTNEIAGKPLSAFELSDMTKIHQGFLEKSTVNPVIEMTRMIEVQRLYEANQKVIQTHDEALEKVIGQVGRGLA